MKNWFKDSEVFFENYGDKSLIGNQIHKSPENIMTTGNSAVLIGIDSTIADSIRRELYKTSFAFNNIYLADLGNVRNNSPEFILPILQEFLMQNINIIILGSNKQQFDSQLKAFENNFLNIGFIEKAGDIIFDKDTQSLIKNSNSIHKAKLLGYQTHLLNNEKLTDALYSHSMRLGQYRNNYREIEPVLRDVDLLMFNMDSIRYSEVPGIKNTSPSGLTSEEACQILKYLGLNTKINIIDIIGYDQKFDFHNQGAMMVSQLIWYYLDGIDQQISDDIFDTSSMSNYVVELNDYDFSLNFFQSKKTGRWWIEVPNSNDKPSYYLPCSQEDYNKATKNEISNRIFNELKDS